MKIRYISNNSCCATRIGHLTSLCGIDYIAGNSRLASFSEFKDKYDIVEAGIGYSHLIYGEDNLELGLEKLKQWEKI